jgi:tRNA dimethylallyltransferase
MKLSVNRGIRIERNAWRLMKPKIIVILGATAVGKSELALELCGQIGGEIINADSQQVYRFLDIGTGKPSAAERARVRHHVIDVVDPDEEFNAALFRELAAQSIHEVHERNASPVICGGTGLYVKALTRGLFQGPGQDPEVRRRLEDDIVANGLSALYQRLTRIDPTVTSTIHRNDRQRVIRALEVYQLTGKRLSEWQVEHGFPEEPFRVLKIGLTRERSELYDRINARCDRMIADGLLEEVRGLTAKGYALTLKPLRSIGYLQMGRVLTGVQELSDAVAEMKQETRHLARRQLTWFRGERDIVWFHAEAHEKILQAIESFLDHSSFT